MPTTAYAVTITPPVAGGFYVPVEVRFEHAAAPAAEPNPNPAYLVRDGSTPLQGRTLISDVTTFYFVATTAVLLSTWAGGDDQSKQSVTPAAYATPTAVALGPTSSGTPSADLSSRYGTATDRRVTHPLGGPGVNSTSLGTTSAADINNRYLLELPVTPTRYRFRVRNYSPYAGAGGAGPLNVTGIYIGTPKANTTDTSYKWKGEMTATATKVTDAFTLTNSTETVTAWYTSPAITKGVPVCVSIGFNNVSGAGSVTIYGDNTGGFARIGAGAGAAADAAAFSGTLTAVCYLDVRIEYEYTNVVRADGQPDVPVVLTVGDSITQGVPPTGENNYMSCDTWPGQVALRNGCAVVNAGIGSTTTANWAAATAVDHKFLGRFDLTTTVPDVAIVALGMNDVTGGVGIYTQWANLSTLVTSLRSFGINRVFLATITPGAFASPISATSGATTNGSSAATVASTIGLHPRMPITGTGIPANTTILAVNSLTSITLSANATATNTGLTFTCGNAATISTAAMEQARQQTNAWIRTLPLNVDGIIDFDGVVRDPNIPSNPIADLIPLTPHPSIAGYQRMAQIVPRF